MRDYWQVWGWYSVMARIANSGLFNVGHLAPIEAAKLANFWEAMTWVAQENHLNSFQ